MEHYTRAPSSRSRSLAHASPVEVSLQAALDTLSDPIRRRIFRHLPVAKSTLSHHFAVLRGVGLLEQRDEGPRRLNRLRRPEFDDRFPGLLPLVLAEPESLP
jgi:hypothetical protein